MHTCRCLACKDDALQELLGAAEYCLSPCCVGRVATERRGPDVRHCKHCNCSTTQHGLKLHSESCCRTLSDIMAADHAASHQVLLCSRWWSQTQTLLVSVLSKFSSRSLKAACRVMWCRLEP